MNKQKSQYMYRYIPQSVERQKRRETDHDHEACTSSWRDKSWAQTDLSALHIMWTNQPVAER